jgi:hypothetical protein
MISLYVLRKRIILYLQEKQYKKVQLNGVVSDQSVVR